MPNEWLAEVKAQVEADWRGTEHAVCQCGHIRGMHGRILIAYPADADIGACWCGCPKFARKDAA